MKSKAKQRKMILVKREETRIQEGSSTWDLQDKVLGKRQLYKNSFRNTHRSISQTEPLINENPVHCITFFYFARETMTEIEMTQCDNVQYPSGLILMQRFVTIFS